MWVCHVGSREWRVTKIWGPTDFKKLMAREITGFDCNQGAASLELALLGVSRTIISRVLAPVSGEMSTYGPVVAVQHVADARLNWVNGAFPSCDSYDIVHILYLSIIRITWFIAGILIVGAKVWCKNYLPRWCHLSSDELTGHGSPLGNCACVESAVAQNNVANSFHEEILPERFKQGFNMHTLYLCTCYKDTSYKPGDIEGDILTVHCTHIARLVDPTLALC